MAEDQRINAARGADAHHEVCCEEWRPTNDKDGEHRSQYFDRLALRFDRVEQRFLLYQSTFQ